MAILSSIALFACAALAAARSTLRAGDGNATAPALAAARSTLRAGDGNATAPAAPADNWLYFDSVPLMNYELSSYVISSGMPWGNVTIPPNTAAMDVIAGRGASGPPAAAFSAGLTPSNMFVTVSFAAQAPQALNFVIDGDIAFTWPNGTITISDFRIGQGVRLGKGGWGREWIEVGCSRAIRPKASLRSDVSCVV
jgi:hypothetical protein